MKYALMHPVVSSAVAGIEPLEQLEELARETPRLNEMEYEQRRRPFP